MIKKKTLVIISNIYTAQDAMPHIWGHLKPIAVEAAVNILSRVNMAVFISFIRILMPNKKIGLAGYWNDENNLGLLENAVIR